MSIYENFKTELKSGKTAGKQFLIFILFLGLLMLAKTFDHYYPPNTSFLVYGQWSGWIAGVLLIILGISNILSLIYLIYGIIALIQGAFLFLLECPFVTQCFRNTDRIIAWSTDNRVKCGIYICFSVIMWVSLVNGFNPLMFCALIETFAAMFYGIAVYRGESGSGSNFVNRQDVATTAVQYI